MINLEKKNRYTIDNFPEIRSEIYKYCVNLTTSNNGEFKIRHKYKADDLFQEVYLKTHETLPNLKKEIIKYGNYLQIVKNITYWTFHASINPKHKVNKITSKLSYYQENIKSSYLFESKRYEQPKVFIDIKSHPDFKFYTKNLNEIQLKIVDLILSGYSIKEITETLKVNRSRIDTTLKILHSVEEPRRVKFKVNKTDDVEFLKKKLGVDVFNKLNLLERHMKLYSLYLQGYSHKDIGRKVNTPSGQITVEIYKIKQRIKKYT